MVDKNIIIHKSKDRRNTLGIVTPVCGAKDKSLSFTLDEKHIPVNCKKCISMAKRVK